MAYMVRDDIDKFFNYSIDIPTKTLYMGERDGVEHSMAERTIKGLHILDAKNRRKPITILMNNVGGDEYHGLAIYDAIKNCKSETRIKVYGHAMSMGVWCLQSANKRLLSANSTVMIHYGTWGYEGHAKDFDKSADENRRVRKLMEDHLLERIKEKHPRYTRETLQDLIRFDKFMTANEAVELGLADKVI